MKAPLLLCSMLLLPLALPVSAFSSQGHIHIEERACAILIEREAAALASGHPLPDYLRASAIIAAVYNLPRWQECKDGMPDARTAFPDHSGERQFAQDLQPYHFMAANRYVVAAAKAAKKEELNEEVQQQRLLSQALPRCLLLMYFLYKEIVGYGITQTSQSGRGSFVLMHIVADSYSNEHAGRTPDMKLLTVKGWQLSRLGWPAAATTVHLPDSGLLMLHRTRKAMGDEDWRGCNHGLSDRAEAAAQACADLMQAICGAAQRPQQLDSEWQKFAKAHFQPANSKVRNGWFVLKSASDSIQFDLQYKPGDAFIFDYHEDWSLLAVGQMGWPDGRPLGAWGAEFGLHFAPGPADQAKGLWKRIEWGGVVALTSVPLRPMADQPRARATQLNAFLAPNLTTVPLLNSVLQTRIGAGYLLDASHEWGWAFGVDMIWNAAKHLDTAFYPGRIALGYEFDHASLPARNSLVLKLGLNAWNTRVPSTGKAKDQGTHRFRRQQQQQQQQQQLLRRRAG